MKSVPVQPKNLEVTAEVHPSIKSYAELSCSVYVIGYRYEALVDKELWSEGMATLSLEMVNLLMKLASCVKENVGGGVWRERVEASLVHPEQLSVRGGGVRVASHHHRSGRVRAR